MQTEKEQIQNQIQELQEKLQKLEEVENEKMEFKDEGRFHFFHYNGKPYQRLEYTAIPNVSWFESLSTLEYPIPVYEKVMNSELNKKLEELYQKQIVPEEPEENEWKSAALRFGEELVSVGPNGYYDFTAGEWFDWVVNTYKKLCDDTVKLLKKENLKKAQERGERVHKKMEETIKIHDGYGVVDYKPTPQTPVEECYKDWWGQYPELETDSKYDDTRWQGFQAGYEFAYAISTAKEVMEKVQKEQEVREWDVVRESMNWCKEHPGQNPLDWVK